MGAVGPGCVKEVLPSIAHTHIGHSLSGWHTTPDKQGLFIIAEQEATVALEHAGFAFSDLGSLESMQLHASHVLHALDPKQISSIGRISGHALGKTGDMLTSRHDMVAPDGTAAAGQAASHGPVQLSQADGMPGLGFGLLRAIKEAIDHIEFAGTSKDATPNVQAGAVGFAKNGAIVVERAELIIALAQEVLASNSIPDAAALVEEIARLCQSNVEGVDHDGDGVIGSRPDEFGLKQLRKFLSDMIAREVPAYVPVAEKYLFGLIRLATGEWTFRQTQSVFADDEEGGGGGGSY